jgi:hypothetical protein
MQKLEEKLATGSVGKGIQETLAFKLAISIAELIENSGATQQEAAAAIATVGALLSEMPLSKRATVEIQT